MQLLIRRCVPLVLLLALVSHAAADAPRVVLSPGLYRVDFDAETSWTHRGIAEQKLSGQSDGNTGDEAYRVQMGGHDAGTHIFKGSAPVTYCARAGASVGLPPLFGPATACKTLSTTRAGDAVVHVASCSHGKVTVTMRRLDETTWEYISLLEGTGGRAPGLGGLKPALEYAVKYGKTAEERARAAKLLADLPRMQADANHQHAAAAATLDATIANANSPEEAASMKLALANVRGGSPIQARSRTVLTRISGACSQL